MGGGAFGELAFGEYSLEEGGTAPHLKISLGLHAASRQALTLHGDTMRTLRVGAATALRLAVRTTGDP